jgi:hypothetical protein
LKLEPAEHRPFLAAGSTLSEPEASRRVGDPPARRTLA